MACDVCDCDDHPNTVCATCLNCIGHHTISADYDQILYEYTDADGVTHDIVYEEDDITDETDQQTCTVKTKPHYRYNGRTGEITMVNADESSTTGDSTADLIAESFGL